MRAKVKNIMLQRREGMAIGVGFDKYDCSTFEEAQTHLRVMGITAPEPGNGYDKVNFIITWEGDKEDEYQGRFDMQRGGLDDSGDTLQEHVKNNLLFLAGKLKPAHMSEEQYNRYLTEGRKEEAQEYLDTHEI